MLVPFLYVLYNRTMRALVCLLMIAPASIQMSATGISAESRAPSSTVWASMAILATLQDADVLPPEGTKEANHVVHVVIQVQSLFMKSTDPVVRAFFVDALTAKWGVAAADREAGFRQSGWTSEIVEAVSMQYRSESTESRQRLAPGFIQFNVRLGDLELLTGLFGKAQARFAERGQDIHRIFYDHRRTMPGGRWFDRKEKHDGDQGLHPYQS